MSKSKAFMVTVGIIVLFRFGYIIFRGDLNDPVTSSNYISTYFDVIHVFLSIPGMFFTAAIWPGIWAGAHNYDLSVMETTTEVVNNVFYVGLFVLIFWLHKKWAKTVLVQGLSLGRKHLIWRRK